MPEADTLRGMLCYFRPLVLIILLCSFIPSLSLAAPQKTPLRIGIFPLEPLNFINNTGKAAGLYPALINEIAKEENWQVQFVPGSWAEGLARLQNGEIDLVTTIANTPERMKLMDFSHESVVDIWGQIYTLPRKNIDNILDLENVKVGVMRRDINAQNFISLIKQFGIHCQIIEFPSHVEVFHAIENRDIVAGVAPQHYGLGHTKEFNLVATSIRFSPFSVYFSAKKGEHQEILQQIDIHIGRWKKAPYSLYHQQLSYWIGGKSTTRKLSPTGYLSPLGLAGSLSPCFYLLTGTLTSG